MTTPRRILFLMSDTGGGHRAAAEAIIAALTQRHGDAVHCEMVDFFRDYSPAPYKYAPELYPLWVKRGKLLWTTGYHLSDRKGQSTFVARSLWLAIRRGLKRLFAEHPADLVVSVHPFVNLPAMYVLNRLPERPPFMTVVTDLVSTHALWYNRRAERILVPTQPAFERGLKFGIAPERLRVTGLPVHPRFAAQLVSKAEARARLGWDADLPTVLMIGGGEGMGPLFDIARRINMLAQPCQLIIVCGRNEKLKDQLESSPWNQPTHIYGFVTNMPELMAAADMLVTKAGPGTISEACMAGLPMIISDHIPGQEYGNVRYIIENKAGVYARGPRWVAQVVHKWLMQGAAFLHERGDSARRLARPDAVWDIAEEVWQMAQRPPVRQMVKPPRVMRAINRRFRQWGAGRLRRRARSGKFSGALKTALMTAAMTGQQHIAILTGMALSDKAISAPFRPLLALVRTEQLERYQQAVPGWRDKPLALVPDLAVELAGDTDRLTDIYDRIEAYLDFGVTTVWLLIPQRREISVHTAGARHITLLRDDDLLTTDLLPDFRLKINEIFG
jgi:1,2-diacylglycerol 3-beta-galactosyltransferase